MKTLHYTRKTLLLLAALLFINSAWAETLESGTIEGTLGSETRTWYTIQIETDEGTANTAQWTNVFGDFHDFSIQGHTEVGFVIEESLSLQLELFSFPENCPCPADDAEILYFTSSSITQDVYMGEDVSITILELEVLDEERLRLVGEFSGTLRFYESLMRDISTDRTLPLTGTFDVIVNLFELDF